MEDASGQSDIAGVEAARIGFNGFCQEAMDWGPNSK